MLGMKGLLVVEIGAPMDVVSGRLRGGDGGCEGCLVMGFTGGKWVAEMGF